MATQLFTAQTVNADSSIVRWYGGRGTFAVQGTWDTSTLKLQVSFDGGTTYLDVTDASFTADGYKVFELPICKIKANLASVGGSTSVGAIVI